MLITTKGPLIWPSAVYHITVGKEHPKAWVMFGTFVELARLQCGFQCNQGQVSPIWVSCCLVVSILEQATEARKTPWIQDSRLLSMSLINYRFQICSNLFWKCFHDWINLKPNHTLTDMGRTSLTPLWDSLYFAASLGLAITGFIFE